MAPPTYPEVTDATGGAVRLQGMQMVRNYPMPIMRIEVLNTDGEPFPSGPPRAISVDGDGTATVVDMAGNIIGDFPLTAGRNDFMLTAITDLVGITTVWGLY